MTTETRPGVVALREALCAAAVGHYRGWDMSMGEAAHMGMDADDPHGEAAAALSPVVDKLVQAALREYRHHYDAARATSPLDEAWQAAEAPVALDVDRLARAIEAVFPAEDRGVRVAGTHTAAAIAAEYDRLHGSKS